MSFIMGIIALSVNNGCNCTGTGGELLPVAPSNLTATSVYADQIDVGKIILIMKRVSMCIEKLVL